MGVCTSDPLNYLINQYGNDDVCKFVVAEKTEEIIEDIAPKIKKRAKQQIDNSTKEIHKSIEQSDKKINDNFRSTVEDIDKLDPKAISTASKIQGKSTQQILGLNSMRSQVGKIKRNADKKINNQSETIMKQIDEQKQRMKKQYKNNKPSLPIYQNMPICLQQTVLSDGKLKFSKEIKQFQEKITDRFEKAINLKNLSNNLKSISEADRVISIADNSKNKFQEVKKAMSSNRTCFGCFVQ